MRSLEYHLVTNCDDVECSLLESHSAIASLYKREFSYIHAPVDKILIDEARSVCIRLLVSLSLRSTSHTRVGAYYVLLLNTTSLQNAPPR